jgi:hypothetical protein
MVEAEGLVAQSEGLAAATAGTNVTAIDGWHVIFSFKEVGPPPHPKFHFLEVSRLFCSAWREGLLSTR